MIYYTRRGERGLAQSRKAAQVGAVLSVILNKVKNLPFFEPRRHRGTEHAVPPSAGRHVNSSRRIMRVERMPGDLDHIEVNVSNLGKSAAFWGPFLDMLGYSEYQRWPEGISFKRGSTYLVFVQTKKRHFNVPFHRCRTGLNHLAFSAESPEQVDTITEWVKGKGLRILYEDRHPHAGGPENYALYLEDPDRIKVEVVARSRR